MNILDRLRALQAYYKSESHIGHQELLMEGLECFDGEVLVITSGANEAKMLCISPDICIGVEQLSPLAFQDEGIAVAITSHAMEAILEEVIAELEAYKSWKDSLSAFSKMHPTVLHPDIKKLLPEE